MSDVIFKINSTDAIRTSQITMVTQRQSESGFVLAIYLPGRVIEYGFQTKEDCADAFKKTVVAMEYE